MSLAVHLGMPEVPQAVLYQRKRPWHVLSVFTEDRATLESDPSAVKAGYTVGWAGPQVPPTTLSPYRKPFNAINSSLKIGPDRRLWEHAKVTFPTSYQGDIFSESRHIGLRVPRMRKRLVRLRRTGDKAHTRRGQSEPQTVYNLTGL